MTGKYTVLGYSLEISGDGSGFFVINEDRPVAKIIPLEALTRQADSGREKCGYAGRTAVITRKA